VVNARVQRPPVTSVLEPLRQTARRYRGGADRPILGYLALDVTYLSVVSAIGVTLRRRRIPLPERLSVADLGLVGLATHKAARTLAKDAVTSPLRAPFNRYKGPGQPAELNEEIVIEGPAHAVGELLSCPFCLDQWVATGFVTGLVMAPRGTRLVMATFGAVAIADFLQLAYALIGNAAD
jgi:hypothetical protein